MAEVIRPNFGAKRESNARSIAPAEVAPLEPVLPQRSEDEKAALESDIKFALEKDSGLIELRDKIREMRSLIGSLQGYRRNEESIRLRQVGLRGSTFEGLYTILFEGDKHRWTQHPSFYLAAADQYRARLGELTSFVKENIAKEDSDGAV